MEPTPASTQSPSFVSVPQKEGNIGDASGVSQWLPRVKGCGQHHWYTNGWHPPPPPEKGTWHPTRPQLVTRHHIRRRAPGMRTFQNSPPCKRKDGLKSYMSARKLLSMINMPTKAEESGRRLSGFYLLIFFHLDIHASVLWHICSKPGLHKLPFGMFAKPSTCKCAWGWPASVWWENCARTSSQS